MSHRRTLRELKGRIEDACASGKEHLDDNNVYSRQEPFLFAIEFDYSPFLTDELFFLSSSGNDELIVEIDNLLKEGRFLNLAIESYDQAQTRYREFAWTNAMMIETSEENSRWRARFDKKNYKVNELLALSVDNYMAIISRDLDRHYEASTSVLDRYIKLAKHHYGDYFPYVGKKD